jgi:hypothetical protein
MKPVVETIKRKGLRGLKKKLLRVNRQKTLYFLFFIFTLIFFLLLLIIKGETWPIPAPFFRPRKCVKNAYIYIYIYHFSKIYMDEPCVKKTSVSFNTTVL